MLVGRGSERARIDKVLEAARQSQSGVLVLRGEPGIGKTTLLDYANERADGFRVLRATGVQSESELAFAALHELLRPALDRLDALPPQQRQALRTALGLGEPAEVDRFAVYAGTLGRLAQLSEETPLLCLVDDAQWIDSPSAEALRFAARRFSDEPVAVLFAAREGEQAGFVSPELDDLPLAGLHDEAATALLRDVDPSLPAETADRILLLSGGNPLALVEMPAAVRAEGGSLQSLVEPIPVGRRVEEAFLGRVRALSDEAQKALLLAAAADASDLSTIWEALAELEIGRDAIEEAERTRLVLVRNGKLLFVHPLVRSAVYQEAHEADRRRVHSALATVLGRSGAAEGLSWHLAAAAVGPDEEVAAALEAYAESAGLRGGVAVQTIAHERAARLTPDPDLRARRLLKAADTGFGEVSLDRVKRLCREALELTSDWGLKGEIHKVLENTLYWAGELEAAHQIKMDVSRELEEHVPVAAAHMRARATASLTLMLRGLEAVEVGHSALELMRRHGGDDLRVPVMYAQSLARVGELERASSIVDEAVETIERTGERELVFNVSTVLVLLDQYENAARFTARDVAELRSRGAFSELAFHLLVASEIHRGLGRLLPAYAASLESVQLAEQLDGEMLQVAMSVVELTVTAAAMGREEEARKHAARALELGSRVGSALLEAKTRTAVGELELSLGRSEAAGGELQRVAELVRAGGYGHPAFVQFSPDLVEAFVRTGQLEEARREAATLSAEAERTSTPWTLAVAARCRALVADEGYDAIFEEALQHHEASPRALERARTLLAYGERLRRDGQRVEARERLRAASKLFESGAAGAWAERAQAELAASGETTKRRGDSGRDDLTPQELQVAMVVARGVTNREAAAELFLSPKTIEFHLRNAYRKLGVRSRTQLAQALSG